MNTELSWKKGVFNNTYRIYADDTQIGFVKNSFFSRKTTAEINGKAYLFQERGFFRQRTDIVDVAENRKIGEIKYGSWKSRASIKMNNEVSNWTYTNIWYTKWKLQDAKGVTILYKGSSFSENGFIEVVDGDAIQLLSGLYIAQIYSRITVVVFYSVALLAGSSLLPRAYLAIKGLLWNFFF